MAQPSQTASQTVPALAIRNAVLFPLVSMPLSVSRDRSVKAVEQVRASQGLLLVVGQKTIADLDPDPDDLMSVGTLCKIETAVAGDSGKLQVVVTGVARFKTEKYSVSTAGKGAGYLEAQGEVLADILGADTIKTEALFYSLKDLAREILELLPGAMEPLVDLIDRVDDPIYLTHICSAYLNIPLSQKQKLLETTEVNQRIELLLSHMSKEREVLNLQREIREKMSERLGKAQREAILREQLHTIRGELGEEQSDQAVEQLDQRLRDARLPEEPARQADLEMKRLKGLPSVAAEYHVIRTYLEWLADLPWNSRSESRIDLDVATQILDEDHFGLTEVKRRILQYLAVAKLKNDLHGPILCLLGPPGVGKTSLGASIARALDRRLIRASLGGVRDEAEIRGHRRTYVGAMPGRIIQSIRRAGTKNPVMMLDEIDKLRSDMHGDPSAAMLEVLDPEQNKVFTDHYLDVPFDLSEVFFIATGNISDTIPPALRDRMEIIEIGGYTPGEKLRIAQRFLVPRQILAHGLKPEWIDLPESALDTVILRYTREAGVRELQRKIAALMRSAAEAVVRQQSSGKPIERYQLTGERLSEILGPERYITESAERGTRPGVAIGLAWTPNGGEILFIEATAIPEGKGHLTLTGQLGDVMKESAQIALSTVRSMGFGVSTRDVHIHVPSGAIPKDGPSAGIPIFAALVSLLRNLPIRAGLGMTGEITLRGTVLPVGGIRDKVLAAHRAGLSTLILPARNRPDLREVPEEIQKAIRFVFVNTVEELLPEVFEQGSQGLQRAA